MGIMNLNGFLGHNGGILGYATAMFYLPKRHATVVVEANADNVSSMVATSIFVALASYLFPQQFPNGS
jgi:D-alanyl-D-alanine carboxypeptidase